ncbi:MAG: energy transducer TonB [Myxococcales bacterium]|nr:MAG: energy transducer TonB [Myxococcales bacterium]
MKSSDRLLAAALEKNASCRWPLTASRANDNILICLRFDADGVKSAMRFQEWRQQRRRGAARQLGPWLLASLTLFLFVGMELDHLLPSPEPPPPSTPVAMRALTAKQWMENKTLRDRPVTARTEAKEEKKTEPEKKPEEKKPEPEPPKPEGQIVDIAMPEKEEAPDQAEFVSQYDSKVEKQTKARETAPDEQVAPKRRREGLKQPQPPTSHEEGKLVLDPGVQEESPQPVAKRDNLVLLPDLKMEMKLQLEPDGTRGQFQNRESQDKNLKGNADRLALIFEEHEKKRQTQEPGTGNLSNIPKSLLPDMQTASELAGTPMNDYLRNIEEGDETWLNAKGFKYATYYNQIKRKVAQRWDPVQVQQRYDPTFAVYGYQSRYTVLMITLDDKGQLEKADVARSSGVDFLDQEAVSAVMRASPFPNPPKGILEQDGKISFPFGFFFELSRSGLPIGGAAN